MSFIIPAGKAGITRIATQTAETTVRVASHGARKFSQQTLPSQPGTPQTNLTRKTEAKGHLDLTRARLMDFFTKGQIPARQETSIMVMGRRIELSGEASFFKAKAGPQTKATMAGYGQSVTVGGVKASVKTEIAKPEGALSGLKLSLNLSAAAARATFSGMAGKPDKDVTGILDNVQLTAVPKFLPVRLETTLEVVAPKVDGRTSETVSVGLDGSAVVDGANVSGRYSRTDSRTGIGQEYSVTLSLVKLKLPDLKRTPIAPDPAYVKEVAQFRQTYTALATRNMETLINRALGEAGLPGTDYQSDPVPIAEALDVAMNELPASVQSREARNAETQSSFTTNLTAADHKRNLDGVD